MVGSETVRISASTISVAAALWLFAPAWAVANSSAFNGAGGGVVPVEENRVRMVSERVEIEPTSFDGRERNGWSVEVAHVFDNTTDEEISLTVGFPELPCGGDHRCGGQGGEAYGIKNLEVVVDGAAVETTVDQVDADSDDPDWYRDLDRVHLFDVTFPPDRKVRVEIEYVHEKAGGLDYGTNFTYLTKTGRLWKGRIGEARFVIELDNHYTAYVPKEYELVEREHSPATDGLRSYVFETRNWTPNQNFAVLVPNYLRRFPRTSCPTFGLFAGRFTCSEERKEVTRRALFDLFLSKNMVSSRVVDRLGKNWRTKRMRICRNLPYALHGYKFVSDDLYDHFYGTAAPEEVYHPLHNTWHTNIRNTDEKEKKWTRLTLYPNPKFDKSLFSGTELQYVKAAKYAENHLEELVADFDGGGVGDSRAEEGGQKRKKRRNRARKQLCGD